MGESDTNAGDMKGMGMSAFCHYNELTIVGKLG